MRICPKCETKTDTNFCPKCGTKTVEDTEKTVCPKCGTLTHTKHCPNCGTEIVSIQEKKEAEKKTANEREKKKKKIVIIAGIAIVVCMVGVVAYQHLPFSGGRTASYSFIKYTEPYADDKSVDEDDGDIWYHFGEEKTDNYCSLYISEDSDYDSAKDAAVDVDERINNYRDGYGFDNGREVTVDGHKAVRYDYKEEGGDVVIEEVEFANETTRVTVGYFPAENEDANERGEEAFEELLYSIRYK